ncbi:hypothetical protein H7827_13885 [Streptomyces sp. JH002]|uniref:hypothetical protein n=1 Tax=Streptomyces sp. JH002 TaxID=2763259 RepID=UPI003D80A3D4
MTRAEEAFRYTKTFEDFCSLKVQAMGSGPQGGDTGHGGWAVVSFEDLGSTNINASIEREHSDRANKITIRVGGDAEVAVLADALEWAARRLREGGGSTV